VKPTHLSKQFKLAERSEIPIGVMIGESELATDTVQIKLLNVKEKTDGEVKAELHTVDRSKMVEFILALMKEEMIM
jgi:histidyl-tRNA synthetase